MEPQWTKDVGDSTVLTFPTSSIVKMLESGRGGADASFATSSPAMITCLGPKKSRLPSRRACQCVSSNEQLCITLSTYTIACAGRSQDVYHPWSTWYDEEIEARPELRVLLFDIALFEFQCKARLCGVRCVRWLSLCRS